VGTNCKLTPAKEVCDSRQRRCTS